jgi:hydroxymethylbilane synthase
MKLIFATRPSALARWQTQWVMNALQEAHPGLTCEEKIITTQGDKILDKPLPEIGGKGLFTQELESELLSGAVHCAVHSLKDLPVENPAGLTVGCVPVRAEVRDALISKDGYTLETLPTGALVGTSSLRRAAQVFSARPDVATASLRGNVDTRLRKALEGQYDAIILAGAGLTRLRLESHITQWLPLDVMLPAPGQGALAVQCRADDEETLSLLSALEDASTRAAVTAERQFLLGLGGGCAVPVAAYAAVSSQQSAISLTGLVASIDGKKLIKVTGEGSDPQEVGRQLAEDAILQGANEILALTAER